MQFNEIKKLLTSEDVSIKVAMKMLSNVLTRVVFVVDGEDKLIGSITDGDIRRAILDNVGVERPIGQIMFRSPRSVRHDDKDFGGRISRFIQDERLSAVPVVNEMGRIVDIVAWYDLFEKHPHENLRPDTLPNKVVVMAGGKGERLDPFTKILPKPLIPFGDTSIVERIMNEFHKNGFYNFILTLNYKKELIKMYFRENQTPYDVSWVEEDDYLGTAGALNLVKNKVNDTFFICNCDTLLEVDFRNILLWHKAEKADITVIGCHKEVVIPYGTLDMEDGKLKKINEKPTYDMFINTGMYAMDPKVLDMIGQGEKLDMDRLIKRAIDGGLKVTVYPVYGGWFDIGQWKEYQDSLYLLQDVRQKKA